MTSSFSNTIRFHHSHFNKPAFDDNQVHIIKAFQQESKAIGKNIFFNEFSKEQKSLGASIDKILLSIYKVKKLGATIANLVTFSNRQSHWEVKNTHFGGRGTH